MAWYGGRAIGAQAKLLYDRRNALETALERAHAVLRNFDELTFTLESLHDGAISADLWKLIANAGYYTQNTRLQELPINLKNQWRQISLEVLPSDVVDGPLYLGQYSKQRADFADDLIRLETLLPDKLNARTFSVGRRSLWQLAQYSVNAALHYFRELERTCAGTSVNFGEKPVFFTTIDVWVARDTDRPRRGGVFNLIVEIDYVEPVRARRRCKIWAGADEDLCIFRFEMPLLLFRDIGSGYRIGTPFTPDSWMVNSE
jgi:hypothetical protein